MLVFNTYLYPVSVLTEDFTIYGIGIQQIQLLFN